MSGDQAAEPSRGSPRVASWIHEVINPLLESIPIEVHFLQQQHSTFRYWSARLEYMKEITGYLSPGARHVLADFARKTPEVHAKLKTHDELLGALRSAASEAHAALMSNDEFTKLVKQRLTEYATTPPRHPSNETYPGGGARPDDYPKVVAQHVVNAVESQPEGNTDAVFWTRFGREFLDFARGSHFEHLKSARSSLLAYDQELLRWLEDTRFALCERYDVPAAPSSFPASE